MYGHIHIYPYAPRGWGMGGMDIWEVPPTRLTHKVKKKKVHKKVHKQKTPLMWGLMAKC